MLPSCRWGLPVCHAAVLPVAKSVQYSYSMPVDTTFLRHEAATELTVGSKVGVSAGCDRRPASPSQN